MEEKQIQAAQALLKFATKLDTFTLRLMMLIAMLLSAVAFGAVLVYPDPMRLGAACAFSLLVFWPVVRMFHSDKPKPQGDTNE